MNPARAAAAYEKIAEGFAELALAVGEPAAQAAIPSLPPFEEPRQPNVAPPPIGPDEKPSGSEAVCPAHGKPFVDGKYGLFCPSQSDDPEWSNARGYCRITPKSAPVWLRQHA